MTDRVRTTRRSKPSAFTVFAASAALFFAALGFLAYQLAQGRDPALGASVTVADTPKRPVVTVRRIIKRRVVTTVVPAPVAAATTVSSAAAPATGYSAPAAVAAPAPAPAPAPVVSASS